MPTKPQASAADTVFRRDFPGLQQFVLSISSGEIIVNHMAANAKLPPHTHLEAQFGFAVRGTFELHAAELGRVEIDESRGYILAPSVLHGARTVSRTGAVTIDVKSQLVASYRGHSQILERSSHRTDPGNECFQTDWLVASPLRFPGAMSHHFDCANQPTHDHYIVAILPDGPPRLSSKDKFDDSTRFPAKSVLVHIELNQRLVQQSPISS